MNNKLEEFKKNLFGMLDREKHDINIKSNEILEANILGWLVQTLHCNGLCQFISRYAKKKYNIQYRNFYEAIFKYAECNRKTNLGSEYCKIIGKYKDLKEGESPTYIKPHGDNIEWSLVEGSLVTFILEIELFYKDILEVLSDNFDMDQEELVDIICFNRFILKTPMQVGKLLVTPTIKECLKFYDLDIKNKYLYISNEIKCDSLFDYGINYIWRCKTSLLYKPKDIKGTDNYG